MLERIHSSYHIISYHIISYHIISYHIISYHIISYHIISYHIISYHIISCIVLYICLQIYIIFTSYYIFNPSALHCQLTSIFASNYRLLKGNHQPVNCSFPLTMPRMQQRPRHFRSEVISLYASSQTLERSCHLNGCK